MRRGLVRAEVRERPRRPLAGRPAPARGARPPGSALTGDQAAALRLVTDAIAARDPTPILLDGVTGGGKTAIYVEAIAASLAAGRPAMVLVPEIALATPLVDRLRAELPARIAVLHSAWATASAPTSGAGSGRATSTSSSGPGRRSSHRSRTSG